MMFRRDILKPLRRRVFLRVWAGQFVNVIGDAVFAVAVAALLSSRKDGGLALGLVLALVAVGGIVSVVVGGVLADRYRRGSVIIAADLVRSGGVVLLLLLGAGAPLTALCVAAVVIGVGTGLYRPAYAALFPALVPEEEYASANGLRVITNRVAIIVGGAIGGLAVATSSPDAALVADVVTFGVSVVTLLKRVEDKAPEADESGDTISSMVRAAADGFRYVRHRAWILAVMLQGTVQVALVTSPVNLLLPLAMRGSHGAYGGAVAAEGLGALLGAGLGGFSRSRYKGAIALLGCAAELALTIPLALGSPIWILDVGAFLTGAGLSLFAILWTTALQLSVPNDLRGRVFSLDTLSAISLSPLGYALAGLGVKAVGTTSLATVSTVVLGASVVACLAVPGTWEFATGVGEPRSPVTIDSQAS